MAKELPYFRFTVQEWQNGDITLEDYETQGLFMNVCCYYWINNCDVTKEKLYKKFANAKQLLDNCVFAEIIKINASGLLEINFLDEQYKNCTGISKKRSKAGRKGGLAKVANAKQKLSKSKANAKQEPIYKDKDKDKDNTCFSFNDFWSAYGKKVDRVKAEKKYSKLSEVDRLSIKEKLPLYIQSTPDDKYRKNPLTYLNGKCWNDEIQSKPTLLGSLPC